jgi:hypothetical protein
MRRTATGRGKDPGGEDAAKIGEAAGEKSAAGNEAPDGLPDEEEAGAPDEVTE